MTEDTRWLSRVYPGKQISGQQLIQLGGLDPYRQHQALCRLFQLPHREERSPQQRTFFLFRTERIEPGSFLSAQSPELVGLPVFYVLSTQIPEDGNGIWQIDTPQADYRPDLREGDRLAFQLRANPVVTRTGPDSRRARHDVVMDAKRRLNEDDPHRDQASVAYEAGQKWLQARAERHGFKIEDASLRVDGYTTWRQHYGKKIQLSTLDFAGNLIVSDAIRFREALFNGIGPAKAFGCGLLMIRRIQRP